MEKTVKKSDIPQQEDESIIEDNEMRSPQKPEPGVVTVDLDSYMSVGTAKEATLV